MLLQQYAPKFFQYSSLSQILWRLGSLEIHHIHPLISYVDGNWISVSDPKEFSLFFLDGVFIPRKSFFLELNTSEFQMCTEIKCSYLESPPILLFHRDKSLSYNMDCLSLTVIKVCLCLSHMPLQLCFCVLKMEIFSWHEICQINIRWRKAHGYSHKFLIHLKIKIVFWVK